MVPSRLSSGSCLTQVSLKRWAARETLQALWVWFSGRFIRSSMLLSFSTYVWPWWTILWWRLNQTRKTFGNSAELMPGSSSLMMLIYLFHSISGHPLSTGSTELLDMRRNREIWMSKNQSIFVFGDPMKFTLYFVLVTWSWWQNWLIDIWFWLRTVELTLPMGKHWITSEKRWRMPLIQKKTDFCIKKHNFLLPLIEWFEYAN